MERKTKLKFANIFGGFIQAACVFIGGLFLFIFLGGVGWTWMRLNAWGISYSQALARPQPNSYDIIEPRGFLFSLTIIVISTLVFWVVRRLRRKLN